MIKLKLIFVLGILVMLAPMVFGQGITGSSHDFSGETWNSSGRICVVCHTPHNADASVNNSPLWNHETTTATFTLYSTATLDATPGQPDESAKLCLSCHDGTVALDNYGGTTTGTDFITGNALLGSDLANDHPVSFTYNTALATSDGELFDPSTANSGLGGTIDDDMLLAGKMQCASCHDVHNTSGVSKMLRKGNSASALCFTCHDK